MTDGADAQRSHWIPADTRISREGLEKPGFQFLWKLKLDNQAVQLNSLTPAVLIDRYIGYRGFRSLALLAGSSNAIYAIDTDLSRLEWQHRLPLPPPSAEQAAIRARQLDWIRQQFAMVAAAAGPYQERAKVRLLDPAFGAAPEFRYSLPNRWG